LVFWDVKFVVVIEKSACSASLSVDQSESQSGKDVALIPLNLGDSEVSELLQGHGSDLIHIWEHNFASHTFTSAKAAAALYD